MGRRWVRLFVPQTAMDRAVLGPEPVVIGEAPRDPFHGVTLATDREVGLFVRKALPPGEVDRGQG